MVSSMVCSVVCSIVCSVSCSMVCSVACAMLSPYSCPSPPFLALSLKQARGSMVCSMVCSTSQTINHGLLYGLLYGLLRSLLRGLLYGLLYGLLCGVLHASPLLLTLTSALNPNSHQEQAHAHRSGRPSIRLVAQKKHTEENAGLGALHGTPLPHEISLSRKLLRKDRGLGKPEPNDITNQFYAVFRWVFHIDETSCTIL